MPDLEMKPVKIRWLARGRASWRCPDCLRINDIPATAVTVGEGTCQDEKCRCCVVFAEVA